MQEELGTIIYQYRAPIQAVLDDSLYKTTLRWHLVDTAEESGRLGQRDDWTAVVRVEGDDFVVDCIKVQS